MLDVIFADGRHCRTSQALIVTQIRLYASSLFSFRDLLHARYRSSTKAKKLRKQSVSGAQGRGVQSRSKSEGDLFTAEVPSSTQEFSMQPNERSSSFSGMPAAPCACKSHNEVGDIEPISYDAAMSLPPYPDFNYAPLNQPSSSAGTQSGDFGGQDLSFFFQMMQGVRSTDESDNQDPPKPDANRQI